MSTLGNILWLLLGGGFPLALAFFTTGLAWCCTIIGIPLGIASFRLGVYALLPFGRQMVEAEIFGQRRIFGTAIFNVIWFLFEGLWLALACVFWGAILCCTVIGIPLGLALFKIASASLSPLGKRIATC